MKTKLFSLWLCTVAIFVIPYNATGVSLLGGYNTDGFSRDILIRENIAYLADGYWGLKTFNIADFKNITLVDQYMPDYVPGRNSYNLLASENYLYMTDRTGGTLVFSLATPDHPEYLSTVPPDFKSNTLAKNDNNLFVGEVTGGLVALSLADPAHPVEVGRIKLPSDENPKEAQGIAFKGNHAFVANPWGGLAVVDTANPTNMRMVGYYDKPPDSNPGIWDVAVYGDYAYVLAQQYGLQVIDISDVENPTFFSELRLPNGTSGTIDDPPNDIKLFNDYAVVTNGTDGFYIIGLNSAGCITVKEHVEVNDFYAWGARVEGNNIYISNGYGGFLAYDASEYMITPIPEPVLLLFSALILFLPFVRRKNDKLKF